MPQVYETKIKLKKKKSTICSQNIYYESIGQYHLTVLRLKDFDEVQIEILALYS